MSLSTNSFLLTNFNARQKRALKGFYSVGIYLLQIHQLHFENNIAVLIFY